MNTSKTTFCFRPAFVFFKLVLAAAAVAIAAATALHAQVSNYLGGNIDVSGSWDNGVPTSSFAATFSTVGGTGNFTSPVSFGEIVVSGAPLLTLGPGNGGSTAITLGNVTGGTGIDMSAATAGVTISAPVTLAASQIWNVAASQTLTVSGIVSGTGLGITKNGAGTVALNAANTFTGAVTINTGTVSFNNASSFGGASGSVTLNGGTLTNALGATALATPITVTSGNTAAMTETGSSVSYSGAITINSGATLNAVIPTGDTFTLTGSGSMAGAGTVELGTSAGTLRFNSANTGSTGTTFDLGTSATLQTRGVTGGQTVALGALEGGSSAHLIGAGSTVGLTTYSIGANGASTTFSGNIAEHAANEEVSIVKVGTGTLTLSNTTSTFASAGNTAITINAGTLAVASLANGGSASSIGQSTAAASNISINGGTLQYIGTGSSTNRLFTIGTANATLDASGTGAVTFTNATAIVISANTTAAQGNTLTLTGCNTGANTLTPILGDESGSNSTALVKSGAGEWILAGANTYSGGTNISSGTLAVSGTGTLGAGRVVIGSSGVLDISAVTASSFTLTAAQSLSGSGSVNAGSKTLVDNGQLFLSAGSPTTLTVSTGGFTLGSTSTSNYAVNSGSLYNQLVVTSGALTYGGALDLNFGSPLTSGTFNLFTFTSESGDLAAVNISGSYSGSLSDSGGVWTGSLSGTNFTFTDGTGVLVLSTVPEPAVYGLAFAAMALLLARQRRRLA